MCDCGEIQNTFGQDINFSSSRKASLHIVKPACANRKHFRVSRPIHIRPALRRVCQVRPGPRPREDATLTPDRHLTSTNAELLCSEQARSRSPVLKKATDPIQYSLGPLLAPLQNCSSTNL